MATIPVSLDESGVVCIGRLPKHRRVFLRVTIESPSAESYRIRVLANDARPKTIGVYGMGAPLESLPKHAQIAATPKEHRIEITDMIRDDEDVDLRLVVEKLDGTVVGVREAPISKIEIET